MPDSAVTSTPAGEAAGGSLEDAPEPEPLSRRTTLRIGGAGRRFLIAHTSDAVIDAVRSCDQVGEPVLVLGRGSNLVVADEGFPGTVVLVASEGIEVSAADARADLEVRVAAGYEWDVLVERAVTEGWVGIEALSGIPGSAGATPMQNVGAYGQEVADTVASVRTWDRQDGRVRTLSAADCEFVYRSSRLKLERFRGGPRFVVLEVTFQLRPGSLSAPIRYAELARTLGVQPGERSPLPAVRDAVLGLRRTKGMVLDDADHDTWSAGSFFTNPILDAAAAERLPDGAPRWPAGDGLVKVGAAWLIEQAGYGRGYGLPGPVSLSTKHTLAVTNRGGACTEDVLTLARVLRDGVRARFGVELVPEPSLVGCVL